KPIGGPFDLIWVGSLFTHLPQDEMLRLLRYLRDQLRAPGLLIFTVHGPLVVNRLKERERTYNLTEGAISEVLSAYNASGFGFASYQGQVNYGISIASSATIMNILSEVGMTPVLYKAYGWAGHQDVYASVL